jgi:oxalate---CoA ligase
VQKGCFNIGEYLRAQAEARPGAPAIMARRRAALSYAGLLEQVSQTLDVLNRAGYGRGDRIGLALPQGPEATVALIALLAGVVCVPLNPAAGASELRVLLPRCRLAALITIPSLFPHFVDYAVNHRIPVIQLTGSPEHAGRFSLNTEARFVRAQEGFSREQELSAVFTTSGTTGLPKLIPLTQFDLCSHARRAVRFLELSASDRCLDLLPSFHHDAVAVSILSTIFSGASSVYPAAPSTRHFLGWMREFQPTWCAAPPPFFHALLRDLGAGHSDVSKLGIRNLFSCGAPLDDIVISELERMFQAPLRNCYGTTECGNIAVTAVSHAARKPGSAGLSVGLEIAIADASGELLPRRQFGEIVVRGPGVFHGYDEDPNGNANTFFGDWYRTGDLGYLDEDGHLFLTGRIQEFINRGGEKVAPLEVDDVLRNHPAIEDAATFGVPHPVLGEDVVAAIVLSREADPDEIYRFAAKHLSAFKLPRRILVVPAIPRGPTGKVQRKRLADFFADELTKPASKTPPD